MHIATHFTLASFDSFITGAADSAHCSSLGRAIIVRGETWKRNNHSSQCNRSLANCLLLNGRVISFVWFPKTYSPRYVQNHQHTVWCVHANFLCYWGGPSLSTWGPPLTQERGPWDFLWSKSFRQMPKTPHWNMFRVGVYDLNGNTRVYIPYSNAFLKYFSSSF